MKPGALTQGAVNFVCEFFCVLGVDVGLGRKQTLARRSRNRPQNALAAYHHELVPVGEGARRANEVFKLL